jgi:ferritin
MPVEKSVIDALNVHMGREFEAHLQYLSVSSWFDSEGLPELTKFFSAQAAEEHVHAMKVLAYVQDVGGPVVIPALGAPKPSFESAEEAVAGCLEWETTITDHIHALVDLAVAENDHPTQVFLQWFVTEQVEEIATMSELLQVTRRAGESNLLLLEDYVARRASAPV